MDQLGLDALQQLAQSDPASLDMALLGPMQEQLKALQDQGEGEDVPPELMDQYAALEGAVDALMTEQISRLNKMCEDITQDFDKAVKAKKPIEERWIDDECRFMGDSPQIDSKLLPNDSADPANRANKPITVKATRSRVLMCAARLADMMLPANDFPIRVDPSDEPDVEEFPSFAEAFAKAQQAAQPQQGQQPGPQPDPKAILTALAAASASKMQQRIFKMLSDAGFQQQARKAVFDCSRIGTGLLKALVEIGRHEKLARILGFILLENHAMQKVARKAGFELRHDAGGGQWQAVIQL